MGRVGGKVGLNGVEGLAELALNVDHGGGERLAHGLGHDVAYLGVEVPLVHEGLEVVAEGGQVEVPVLRRAKLGLGARELRDGVDELLGIELVAKVAFVGIGLLGLAAAHGALADDLAAVEELAGLGVKKLQGGHLAEVAALVQTLQNLAGHLGVDGLGRVKAGAGVEVERDAVGVEGRLLGVVVGTDVVGDGAVVALGLDLLAVALHDGGAVAVGAGDEDDVLLADAVAQEAGEEVGRHEDATDVAEVEVLVAVGHAAGYDGATGKVRAVLVRHVLPLWVVSVRNGPIIPQRPAVGVTGSWPVGGRGGLTPGTKAMPASRPRAAGPACGTMGLWTWWRT